MIIVHLQIMYKKGLEMLKIFKNHTLKTSLLDDFIYYENRQKIMKEEKSRLLIKSIESPYFVPSLDPPLRLNRVFELLPTEDDETIKPNSGPNNSIKTGVAAPEQVSNSDVLNTKYLDGNAKHMTVGAKDDVVSTLKIGSLTINPKKAEPKPLPSSAIANNESVDIVTVGSVPIKVNGFAESGILTVGTIPLDPKALKLDKGGASVNIGSQR